MKSSVFIQISLGFTLTIVITVVAYIIVIHKTPNESESEAAEQSFVRSFSDPVWGYRCVDNRCVKTAIETGQEEVWGLQVCRLNCSEPFGTVWPKPTGSVSVGNGLVAIDGRSVEFRSSGTLKGYWDLSAERFRVQLGNKLAGEEANSGGYRMVVELDVKDDSLVLNHDTVESYRLSVGQPVHDQVIVTIEAENYFGARHGLETLAQLIVFDDLSGDLLVMVGAEIQDAPAYPHRGLSLDTVRHYVEVESIKRTIDALAMVKMNVFHWHITDSQSWPLVIKSHPILHTFGAYSRKQIYTAEDVEDIVQYALVRGVRIIPELDAPGHIGEGWEKTGLVSCFNYQPWVQYCEEPPCGQFDPTKEQVYEALEDVYREMNAMFAHSDLFHMGGDEVKISCWNTSTDIQQWMLNQGWGLEEADFLKLWNHFQTNALERLDKSLQDNRPIILWTSRLTDEPYVDQYLDSDRYIIQAWTTADDPIIPKLLQKRFRLIISNYDVLYLDCGFPGWVQGGLNWCAPYSGWQDIYDNDFFAVDPQLSANILGSEAALWTEQADRHTLDSRLWPRLSALAERLWTNPVERWQSAESRMMIHRERLVENGVGADSLQPTWCLQNEGVCPIDRS
ncbi:chitooligosaccharidolytic beta-N-acetylglucosaminidase-like isoform X2 [Culex pipiens pallens]|uniref:chitooligosaccharidolytic beta-N-acetylglucosaminidase-like isoform X2 n=1 Tax=Culex pipiens pallens TaxID=42434 RepID=UPI001953160A|nr:chitooligosaccharidolytic beta-N-acetylglucosaminidase-like isoform X2 [Culex pipiens pallens]